MYLLDLCTDGTLDPVLRIIGIVIRIIWIGVPIALIILGSIDLGKAVISSKEDEVKKAKKAFINRLIYAVLVFAVVWIVTVVIGFVVKVGIPQGETDPTGWSACWERIMSLK